MNDMIIKTEIAKYINRLEAINIQQVVAVYIGSDGKRVYSCTHDQYLQLLSEQGLVSADKIFQVSSYTSGDLCGESKPDNAIETIISDIRENIGLSNHISICRRINGFHFIFQGLTKHKNYTATHVQRKRFEKFASDLTLDLIKYLKVQFNMDKHLRMLENKRVRDIVFHETDMKQLSFISPRTLEYLTYLSSGMTKKEVAQNLKVSVSAVKQMCDHLIDELYLTSESELRLLASTVSWYALKNKQQTLQ